MLGSMAMSKMRLFFRNCILTRFYGSSSEGHIGRSSGQSISKSSCILYEFSKKNKRKTKNSYPTETLSISSSILIFYPRGAARHLCLALSASHPFLNFGEAVGFHSFSLAISFYIIAILGF